MSGCMNACGHHHVGHIGILGVDKHGEEWYQITPRRLGQRRHRARRGHRPVGAASARSPRPSSASSRSTARCGTRTSASSTPCAASGSRRSRPAPMRHILRQREWLADDWRYLGEEDPGVEALIVPLAELRTDPERWRAHPGRLGVRLGSGRPRRGSARRAARASCWWPWSSPTRATAAATRAGGCCARATASPASCGPSAPGCARTRYSSWRVAALMPSSWPPAKTRRRRCAAFGASTLPISRALRSCRCAIRRSVALALRQLDLGEHLRHLRGAGRGARGRRGAAPGAAPAAARTRTCTCAAACRAGNRSRSRAGGTGARHRRR